jgi:hypothetical protein
MGDVIDFPIRPFNARKQISAGTNFGPVSDRLLDDMYWQVNALNLGDVEIVRLCGDCIKAGATECKSAECGFFSPDR